MVDVTNPDADTPDKDKAGLSWDEIIERINYNCHDTSPLFVKWLKSRKYMRGYFFNGLTWKRMFNIWKVIHKQDRDHFTVVSGMEGGGKSTVAIQMACAVDPTFCIERICFTPEEFIDGLAKSKKGQAFVLDEGNLFLFSRESAKTGNRNMVKLFALMRQKNVCVFICVPNFFTLDSYVRNHRVQTIVHVYKRGKIICYVSESAIRKISKEGYATKQVVNIQLPAGSSFKGWFLKPLPSVNNVNDETYREYKGKHFSDFIQELKDNFKTEEIQSAVKEYLTPSEASMLTGLTIQTLRNHAKLGKVKARKIGDKYQAPHRYDTLDIIDTYDVHLTPLLSKKWRIEELRKLKDKI